MLLHSLIRCRRWSQGMGKHVMYVDDDEALVFLVERALNESARALIHKPNDVDEMCETLQRLLQSSDVPG